MADKVLDTLVRDVLQSVLCGVLFVVLSIVFRLAARVLRIVEKIPGVRQLNELGGALAADRRPDGGDGGGFPGSWPASRMDQRDWKIKM